MFCLCFLSNSLPLRVLPLIQEGELFPLFLKTKEFKNISRIKIFRTVIIHNRFYFSASQMLILYPSRYKREGTI